MTKPTAPLVSATLCALLLATPACTGTDVFGLPEPDADVDAGGDGADDTGVPDAADAAEDRDLGTSDLPGDPGRDPITDPDAGPDARDLPADVPPDADTGPDGGGTYAPALYRADDLRSPITAYVADRLRAIAADGASRQPDVFMKVGASGTVSTNLLYCFAGDAQPQYVLDLDGRSALLPTIEYFRGGDAAGDTPFDRPTEAAVSGCSAVWAITGSPSPLETEIAAVNPRYAFVNYGTNDMGLGVTYESALFPFYENMGELLDETIAAGIIPIVTGLNPRDDSAAAARWVPTYNTVTRGLAQARQIPYLNLYLASVDLPGLGLLSDGIHGNAYRLDGSAQPCVFTDAALQFNYNVRNLLSIEALHTLRDIVFEGGSAEESEDVVLGAGSAADPFVIDALPFAHAGDTAASTNEDIDAYPACDSGQDESGPEYRYALTLTEAAPLRLIVLDTAGIDVDLHLLAGDGPEDCLARHDRILQGTWPAGTYTVVVDTYVPSDGVPRDGEYLFVALECEPGDTACD